MVMVQFDDKTINIEGRVGGEYWRHDQCLNHLQAMPRVISGRGERPQQKAFGRCTTYWSNHEWTGEQIDLWWKWCYAHPMKNKKGETVYYHPFIAFIHINIKRILAGKIITCIPPD